MLIEAMLLALADPSAIRCGDRSLAGAVEDYARRTQAMDVAGIAALFGDDGASVDDDETIVGSKAIAKLLAGYAGYHVTAETMTVDTTTETARGWRTDGHFAQSGTTPDGTAYAAHGRFSTEWRCVPGSGWGVWRMETRGD